jgi:transcriptional regulator with XRE-family HTH domain
MTTESSWGEKVKRRREELGLTQDDLATRAKTAGHDISAGGIRRIEQGLTTQPQARTIRALAAGLDLDEQTVREWAGLNGTHPVSPVVAQAVTPADEEAIARTFAEQVADQLRPYIGAQADNPFRPLFDTLTPEQRAQFRRALQGLIEDLAGNDL